MPSENVLLTHQGRKPEAKEGAGTACRREGLQLRREVRETPRKTSLGSDPEPRCVCMREKRSDRRGRELGAQLVKVHRKPSKYRTVVTCRKKKVKLEPQNAHYELHSS